MNNTMTYKGYVGSVEIDDYSKLFCGKVLGISDLILFEGQNYEELVQDFHDGVDDYLEICRAENEEPEKPFKGTFNVRIQPDLHRMAAVKAIENHVSLNAFVESAIRQAVGAQL